VFQNRRRREIPLRDSETSAGLVEEARLSANMSVDQADIVSRHLGAGHAYLRAGDAVAAAAEFQQVLAFRPHHIGALGGLAASCNRRGMVDDAITALRAALTIAPQVTNFHVQLGHLLIRKANGEDAQTAFLAALALEPKNAAARGGLEKALTAPGAPAGPGLVEAAQGHPERPTWAPLAPPR
jgi:Tfp pilus assembly protein PilF